MSERRVNSTADDGAAKAAHREYQHQRECILQYLTDCGAATDNKSAGGHLAVQDHYGSEFDTLTIVNTTRAFLTVSDVRMRDGSNDEKVALAELLGQFRRLLPISPLTTTLAEAAGRAVEEKGTRQGGPGGEKRTLDANERAERVRDIIEAAERKPGRPDLFKYPGQTRKAVADRLAMLQLDRNTLNEYRKHVDKA